MDPVRLERIFVPVLVLLLCALLAFLTFWRVDNFGAKGRWSEFVKSSPAVISDSGARVATAFSLVEESTEAGFKPDDIKRVKEGADEVDKLTHQLEPVLGFLKVVDLSGEDPNGLDILAALNEGKSSVTVETPPDFKAQHEKLRKIRTKLQEKSDALFDQVNKLLLEFSNEKRRLDTGWNDAREQLGQTIAESQEVLDLSGLYTLDSTQNKANLQSAIGRAQALLDGAKVRPSVFAEADAQIASYNAAAEKMSAAAAALNAEMVEIDNRPVIVDPEPTPEPVPTDDETSLPTEEPTSSPEPSPSPTTVQPTPTTPTTGGGHTEVPIDPLPTVDPTVDPTPEPTVDPSPVTTEQPVITPPGSPDPTDPLNGSN